MDQFIVLSDMLIDSGQLKRKDFVNPLTDQIHRYRQLVNKNMLFVCVDLGGTGVSIIDCNQDTGDDKDVMNFSLLSSY